MRTLTRGVRLNEISRCVSGGRFGERLLMGTIPLGRSASVIMGQRRQGGTRNLGPVLRRGQPMLSAHEAPWVVTVSQDWFGAPRPAMGGYKANE